MDVTIVVATYGTETWKHLAQQRAVPSARAQGVPVVHVHGQTLHDARNGGLERVDTEWVLHLDADDELEPDCLRELMAGNADLRAPAVRYVRGGRAAPPRMPQVAGHTHPCTADCLTQGNWLVVGTLARAQLLRDVGGWRDFPWSEDWDLWLRCHLANASIEAIPSAVYRAHVRSGSRNRAIPHAERVRVHRAIEAACGLLPGGIRPCTT